MNLLLRSDLEVRPVKPTQVTPAEASDLEQLSALEKLCFPEDIAISRRQFRYLLSQPTTDIWVCREDGMVVADMVVFRRQTSQGLLGRLYSLAVAPEYRRAGYGRRLMSFTLENLRRAGAYAAVLEVNPNNYPALRLHVRMGFAPVRVLPDYYGPGQNGVKMRLVF